MHSLFSGKASLKVNFTQVWNILHRYVNQLSKCGINKIYALNRLERELPDLRLSACLCLKFCHFLGIKFDTIRYQIRYQTGILVSQKDTKRCCTSANLDILSYHYLTPNEIIL